MGVVEFGCGFYSLVYVFKGEIILFEFGVCFCVVDEYVCIVGV